MICIKIRHSLKEEYKIFIQQDLFDSLANIITKSCPSAKYFLITVPPLEKLYLESIKNQFSKLNCELRSKIIKDGEQSKSLTVVKDILDYLFSQKANRHSVLIAFGGGVVGDITGFAASIYMRGIKYVQIATSLIAQVDSSIGGKTGINSIYGKNLIGTFYQPSLVIIDPKLISSLPDKEYLNGLAEVVKYGLLNKNIFNMLEKNIDRINIRDTIILTEIIAKCCTFKAKIVSTDLYDKNTRAILNLGHTIGHALEKTFHYQSFKHGQAIAWGMLTACNIAKKRNLLNLKVHTRIVSLLKSFNIFKPLPKLNANDLITAVKMDKKKTHPTFTFILPVGIGIVKEFNDIREEEILNAINELSS